MATTHCFAVCILWLFRIYRKNIRYKTFIEYSFSLLQGSGRCGVRVPGLFLVRAGHSAQVRRLLTRNICAPPRFALNRNKNLLSNTATPAVATRQLFIGASDPHAAHGQRGRFNCRAAPAAALAVYHFSLKTWNKNFPSLSCTASTFVSFSSALLIGVP